MKKAVFSFITLRTSGDYSWWDEFPIAIGNRLNQEGIDHICYYRHYSANSKHPIENRYSISHKEIKDPVRLKRIISSITKKYDKVIFHHQTPSFRSGLWVFNNRFNKNYHWLTTEHDSWRNIRFSSLKRRARAILRNLGFLPDIIIGCSNASRNRLNNLYGQKNIYFIHNGINIPDMPEPAPLTKPPNRALFVGRLEEYKGLWPLLEAFKIMEHEIDINLTIAGSGPLYEPLQRYIKNHGLGSMITLLGHVSNISALMKNNHFIIIPSIYEESFSITSLEAQANYLPSIYTNSGGLPETQIDEKTGIMILKNNPEAIVKAIKFFQGDIDRFNQMRLNARQNSLNFTMDSMAENYCNLYLELFEK
jgi:glycosyltransferase involved in cell wall biosynthesis